MYINPKSFYEPLAIGAPEPLKQIPAVPMRMIHFFDPSNSRMIDKMKDIIDRLKKLRPKTTQWREKIINKFKEIKKKIITRVRFPMLFQGKTNARILDKQRIEMM